MITNTFPTKDLMIAACIAASDITLIDYKREENYLTFIFDEQEKCKQIEREWFAGTLTINARRFASAIKDLKSLVFSKLG